MARVLFSADFDFHINRRSLKAYKAGCAYTVKRACADQAIAEGKAVEVEVPSRPAARAPAAPRRRRATKAPT